MSSLRQRKLSDRVLFIIVDGNFHNRGLASKDYYLDKDEDYWGVEDADSITYSTYRDSHFTNHHDIRLYSTEVG